MARDNKAHTATANRIAKRYNAVHNNGDGVDIQADGMLIEVETSATLEQGIERLKLCAGHVYVAVTNKEGLSEALRLVQGTCVGVMDPKGNIVKESSDGQKPSN